MRLQRACPVRHTLTRVAPRQVVRSLMLHGASFNVCDSNGDSPLHWVRQGNVAQAVHMGCVGRMGCPCRDRRCLSRAHQAAFKGRTRCVKVMLEHVMEAPSDDDDDDASGEHDLGDDAQELEAVEREAGSAAGGATGGVLGAVVGQAGDAARRGSLAAAALLTAAVRSPSHRRALHIDHHNADGGTPLHSAANSGGIAIGRLLIQRWVSSRVAAVCPTCRSPPPPCFRCDPSGADVDAQMDDGNTPLHNACFGALCVASVQASRLPPHVADMRVHVCTYGLAGARGQRAWLDS